MKQQGCSFPIECHGPLSSGNQKIWCSDQFLKCNALALLQEKPLAILQRIRLLTHHLSMEPGLNAETQILMKRLIECLFDEEDKIRMDQNLDPDLPGGPRHCLDRLIVRTIQAVGGNYSEVMKELESYLKEDERIEHESHRDASGRKIRTIIMHCETSSKPVSYRISTLKKRISELHNLLKQS